MHRSKRLARSAICFLRETLWALGETLCPMACLLCLGLVPTDMHRRQRQASDTDQMRSPCPAGAPTCATAVDPFIVGCRLTPAGPGRPRLGGRPDATPAHRATKAPAIDDFVAIFPRLRYRLPTLHECRCLDHARLASDWLTRLCREQVQPPGSRQKVSVRLHRPPPSLSLPIAVCVHLRFTSCLLSANRLPPSNWPRRPPWR
jgi:hypothetical protein